MREKEQQATVARVAQLVQVELLPPSPMAIGDYRLEHRLIVGPAAGTDFVDYFVLAESYCCFVMINLPTAAPLSVLTAVLLKNISRRLRREFRRSMLGDPGEIVRWLVRELADQGLHTDFGITLGIGSVAAAPLHFVRAGRSAPALLLQRDALPAAVFTDPVAGSLADALSETLDVTAGSALLVVSEGATSALPAIEDAPAVLPRWDAVRGLPARAAGADITALLLRRS